MTMSFEEIYKLTDRVSSETAYSMVESKALWVATQLLEPGSMIVEVGCQYGRSTSILAQAAKLGEHELVLIEPEPLPQLMSLLLNKVDYRFTLHAMATVLVPKDLLPTPIDLLHIDGDHSEENIIIDCDRLLPRVPVGGIVCFHDYGRDSLPDVKLVVDFVLAKGWSRATYETLHVARRLG